MAGAVTHIAKAYLTYQDRPDRLSEMLEWDNILRGAMMRGSSLGMIPDILDMPAYLLTGDTVFSPWGEPAITTPASVQMVGNLRKAVTASFSLAGLGAPNENAFRDINRMNPFRGMLLFDGLMYAGKAALD